MRKLQATTVMELYKALPVKEQKRFKEMIKAKQEKKPS